MPVQMSRGEYWFMREFLEGLPAASTRPARKREPKPKLRNDIRLRFFAGRLHELGPRPIYQLLLELRAGHDLIDTLERYCRLDPKIVRQLGADELTLGVFDGGKTC